MSLLNLKGELGRKSFFYCHCQKDKMLLKCHRAVLDQDETVILGQEDRKKLVKMSNGFEEWEGSFQISFYQLFSPQNHWELLSLLQRANCWEN